MNTQIPLSLLELAAVREGSNQSQTFADVVKLAQHVELLGYKRIWMAEHHNMESIASSATAVLIGHVAGQTKSIRVGSGGVMLPNHSPLVIAEQFGTLETLYPNRIDLGLGRAPGTDSQTATALRRNNINASQYFMEDVKQLQTYLGKENRTSGVRAFPGDGLEVPLWILGSSTDSAYLAAELGLPYAFAAHFAPAQLYSAISIYRSRFKPSKQLDKPYVIICTNVIGADTDEEAQIEKTSLLNLFVGVVTNDRRLLQPPGKLSELFKQEEVKYYVDKMLACTFVGSRSTLREQLTQFIDETQVDELMVTNYIYNIDAKMKSFTILNEALQKN